MPSPKYNAAHRKLRAEWDVRVQAGGIHCHHLPHCEREDTEIHPGEPWDLGHRNDAPDVYTGPEHRKCNRGTARIWKDIAEKAEEYQWFT